MNQKIKAVFFFPNPPTPHPPSNSNQKSTEPPPQPPGTTQRRLYRILYFPIGTLLHILGLQIDGNSRSRNPIPNHHYKAHSPTNRTLIGSRLSPKS
ncbi:Hypothetical predicted protein [Olea europaea subsp. europaea]|uniref:Uncharacterized protein n=1 Tax=Olea europaea subsp. europaea TaxID=158383 RepID=A0A8S0T127_OLEEU|nr:Hypothetical predicted protein [Olea europaea subsp. europaea]